MPLPRCAFVLPKIVLGSYARSAPDIAKRVRRQIAPYAMREPMSVGLTWGKHACPYSTSQSKQYGIQDMRYASIGHDTAVA
eukprot:1392396-Rhodomonas_salina.3